MSASDQVENAQNKTEHIIAARSGSPSVAQESPRKRQKTGISMSQKQALIDNLQLESTFPPPRASTASRARMSINASIVTERARKLRAQYNLQAQGLRTRIEIRVNRIPMALRKAKMGELADKYKNGQHPQLSRSTPSALPTSFARPPPVPEKDTPVARTISQTASNVAASSKLGPGRPPKQTRFGSSLYSQIGPVLTQRSVAKFWAGARRMWARQRKHHRSRKSNAATQPLKQKRANRPGSCPQLRPMSAPCRAPHLAASCLLLELVQAL